MKRSLIILMLVSGLAEAVEWVPVDKRDADGSTAYVERTSISEKNGIVKAWAMWGYTTLQETNRETNGRKGGLKYMSVKYLTHIRCEDRMYAVSQIVFYSDSFGEGDLVHSVQPDSGASNFTDVVPGSMGGSILTFACSKRPRK